MDESEREMEKREMESQAEAWIVIEEFFPSLAYTARELANKMDWPTLFAQVAVRHGKLNEINGFMGQSRKCTKEALCKALKWDLDKLAEE